MGYYDMYVDADTESADVEYDFLTPREVMQALCIGRNTFYRLVNSGNLPAFRIGKL